MEAHAIASLKYTRGLRKNLSSSFKRRSKLNYTSNLNKDQLSAKFSMPPDVDNRMKEIANQRLKKTIIEMSMMLIIISIGLYFGCRLLLN